MTTNALDNFVFRMQNLASSEITEWRAQLAQKTNAERPGKPAKNSGETEDGPVSP